jgi:superfamily II DNA or RNA helicase
VNSVQILVRGPWARLVGMPPATATDLLRKLLTFTDPQRQYKTSFIQGYWDGRVCLSNGASLPAGHAPMVAEWIQKHLRQGVDIVYGDTTPLDPSGVTSKFLPRIERLWDHQMEAIHALLSNRCGITKVPTGGGKTEVALVVAWHLFELYGWRTLLITSRRGLAKQTAERFRMYIREGCVPIKVGQVGDGKRETDDRQIIVATAQTMAQHKPHKARGRLVGGDPVLRKIVTDFEVLILDECHHSSSTTWYDIALDSGAKRRYGMSGTPLKKTALNDMRVMGAAGPLVYDVQAVDLIDANLAARPVIAMVMSDNASGPSVAHKMVRRGVGKDFRVQVDYRGAYEAGIVNNPHHNRSVVRAIEWLHDRGKQTLVLCRRKDHWMALCQMMDEVGITYLAVWGATPSQDRAFAKTQLRDRKARVVLATVVWDEGEDLAEIDAMVLAEGVRVNTSVLQRIGRGMRQGGRDLWVVDFAPTCHRTLLSHAVDRCEAYEAEGHRVILVQEWPAIDYEGPVKDLLPFEVSGT